MTRKSRHAVVTMLSPLVVGLPLVAGAAVYLLLVGAGASRPVAVLAGVVQSCSTSSAGPSG